MIDMRAVDVVQPDICYVGGLSRVLWVADMAKDAALPYTPHSANLFTVTLFTMHFPKAIENAGPYLELSIEGVDYFSGSRSSSSATRLRSKTAGLRCQMHPDGV